jgi:hypothetical protein
LHGNEQQAKVDAILTQIEDNKTAVQQAIDANSTIGCPTLVLQALYKKHPRIFVCGRSWMHGTDTYRIGAFWSKTPIEMAQEGCNIYHRWFVIVFRLDHPLLG